MTKPPNFLLLFYMLSCYLKTRLTDIKFPLL
jgi:hypothetical protein